MQSKRVRGSWGFRGFSDANRGPVVGINLLVVVIVRIVVALVEIVLWVDVILIDVVSHVDVCVGVLELGVVVERNGGEGVEVVGVNGSCLRTILQTVNSGLLLLARLIGLVHKLVAEEERGVKHHVQSPAGATDR